MQEFLKSFGLKEFEVLPLKQDASSRKYWRIKSNDKTYVLMDGNAVDNKYRQFIKITDLLQKQNIYTPKILKHNLDKGYMLLEDLGDTTFTKLLNSGEDIEKLYKMALDILIKISTIKEKPDFIENLSDERIINDICLFIDWYCPAVMSKEIPLDEQKRFINIIKTLLKSAKSVPSTLTLWDYHVDNLMMNNDKCTVIDFQDAVFAPLTYDLMSLVEDARREIPSELQEKLKTKFFNSLSGVKREDFDNSFAFFSIFRHLRVLGRFTILQRTKGKDIYLKHIPNLWRMINITLQNPCMKDLKTWLDKNIPESFRTEPIKKDITKAIILSAGRGTRMRELCDNCPKPLIKIQNKALIDYKLDMLRQTNFKDVIINVCYLKEQIKEHLSKIKDFNINISEEETALETGGGVENALPFLGNFPFFTMNVDEIWHENDKKPSMIRMIDFWNDSKMDILLLLVPLKNVIETGLTLGNYKILKNQTIHRNINKEPGFDLFYSGIAIVHPRIFGTGIGGAYSMRELYDKAERQNRLAYIILDEKVYHVGTPQDLAITEKEF